MNKINPFPLLFLLLFAEVKGYSQKIKGIPFLKNYTPKEYRATPQNLGISESTDGILYFANAAGVLSYNGSEWQLHKIPGNSATNCVYAAKNGNIYIGAYNEFGFFEKQNTGELKYFSLTKSIKKEVGKIVTINELNGEILFQTKNGFYKTRGRGVDFIKGPGNLHIAHYNENRIYVKIKEQGIFEFNGRKFFPIKYGNEFANMPIFGVIKLTKGILVATDTELYLSLYDEPFKKIDVPFTNFNSVKILDKKYLSFGLFGDGLVITDLDFNIIHRLNIDNGLQDATINDQFLDEEKNLWLALNRGISKVEVFSPVTGFGFNQGVKSSIESIKEFKNEIYISTYNGVFSLSKSSRKFEAVNNLKVDCYGLNTFIFNGDTSLFVAANSGIYKIANKNASKIINCIPFNFAQSRFYQNRIFTCNDDGFISYSFIGDSWKRESIDYKITWPVLTFCEENENTLWISDLNEGVYRIILNLGSKQGVTLNKFENTNLPKGFVYVYQYKNKILFGTNDGIYEYDKTKNSFFKSELNPPFLQKFAIHRIAADGKNNLWLSVFYEKEQKYDICYFNGKIWEIQPFKKSSNDIIQCMGFDKDFAYFGSASGLFCYDYSKYIQYYRKFPVQIYRFNAGGYLQPLFMKNEITSLTYDQNDINFRFFAGSFTDESSTEYSYFLDGFSNHWSEWSKNNQAIFTNLHENDYTLKIKAKNIFDVISNETSFQFTIYAPWYRTWWAYTLYVVLFGTFVYAAILYSTRSLKRIIKERTAEVVLQKEEIQLQALVLEEKNRDILDSIKYAKRIQETIIPTEESLKTAITDNLFVFYKPKDIVSGDFYWMKEFNDVVIIGVVDCTGHGVPGAFVSIVGNNGLNRAVNEFGLREPAKILDKLSELTEESFKQSGKEELRDGMDISLIMLNKSDLKKQKEFQLEYAGANNPLWVIREGTLFEEVKANKQPIGKFEARQPFTNHKIKLKKGDAVFLFTDGYADQFGGANGKKFKYKQLQELIITNNQLKYPFLKSLLAQSFETWKKNYEQVDDVCLMGIKF